MEQTAEIPTRFGSLSCRVLGEGPPLLLLHANPGDSRDFEAIAPALSAEWTVHALDWPGFGGSPALRPPSSATAMAFADALEDVTAALPGRLALIGNSVGGYAAARLAARQPERVGALVLVNPGGFTPHNAATRAFCRFKGGERVTAATSGLLARAYLRRRTPTTAAMRERAGAQRVLPERVATEAALWRSFTDPEHDLRARAGAISCPTLVVWGKRDPLLPLRRDGRAARSALPGARFEVMDTGHAAFAEDPGGFLALVRPFLRQTEAARGA